MPDRVPLVHRHRTPYHFHYEDEDEERRIPPSQGQEGSDPFEHTHIGGSSSSSHSERPPSRGLSPPLTILRAKHPAAAALQHRPTTTVAHGHRSPSPTPKSAPPSLPPPKSPHGKKPATGNKPSPPPHLTSSWPWVLFGSLTLTINAGYINSITLHNLHGIPSAHVTGIVARASNLFAEADWSRMSLYVVAYCCFVSGACMGGLLISHETFYMGRNYARALFLTAAIQGVALVIESHWDHSVYFIYACCLAMGLQNSLTSKYSGSVVRTTHLTGASTDLGIAIGHIMKGRSEEWWKVKLHGIAVFGFFTGGVIGHFSYEVLEHGALLVNVCLTTTCALIHTLYLAYHERLSPLSILESRKDIRLHKHRVGPSPRHNTPRSRPRRHWGRNTPTNRSLHALDRSGQSTSGWRTSPREGGRDGASEGGFVRQISFGPANKGRPAGVELLDLSGRGRDGERGREKDMGNTQVSSPVSAPDLEIVVSREGKDRGEEEWGKEDGLGTEEDDNELELAPEDRGEYDLGGYADGDVAKEVQMEEEEVEAALLRHGETGQAGEEGEEEEDGGDEVEEEEEGKR